MGNGYQLLFSGSGGLCVILPSLSFSVKRFKERIKTPENTIYLVEYSGFGGSGGCFPGNNIIKSIDKSIGRIESDTGRKVSKVIGDSYGGLMALGLLSRYGEKYGKVDFVLTSPVISFNRLNKDEDSPQSREGFIRYLSGHELIRKVDKKELLDLVGHREVADPFEQDIPNGRVVIYHYEKDGSLDFSVSEEFSRLKGIKLIRLGGDRHALINFDEEPFNSIVG